jgi:hypothetical protein
VVGPVLDRFRHGRRYALAATMLGRAFLAWLISDYIHGLGLYPAAFGVLLLSRAYGVARSAAVPRLLPATLGLSEAGARASLFGTIAGAAVAPLGAAAFWFGPQWPLRVASVIFLAGMVIALRLPPRADSDPPETVPQILVRGGRKVLAGRLVLAVVSGGALLRGLLGFLTLFLAFAVRSGAVPTHIFGFSLGRVGALAVVAVGLGAGGLLATAVGTRLRIRRPALLQAGMTVLAALSGLYAAARFSLFAVAVFCLVASAAAGLAKLAVDATIQERIREQVRASAFAHSETTLMIAWVFGGAFGLIPFGGRLGIGIAAVLTALFAARAVLRVGLLRKERLHGDAHPDGGSADPAFDPDTAFDPDADTEDGRGADRPRWTRLRSNRAEDARTRRAARAGRTRQAGEGRGGPAGNGPGAGGQGATPTRPLPTAAEPTGAGPTGAEPTPQTTRVMPRDEPDEEPTYHLYRPSGTPPAQPTDDE